jgi:ArsR family transcriptional regulator, arsenate/arsenite/antimonite-responsive transcriptional repressor
METTDAVPTLAALAHEGRLAVFRELVAAGPDGLAAGEVARRVGIAPNTLSASFTVLCHAGLVRRRREGRSIIYSAAYDRMAALLEFMMEDCCHGRPEVCAAAARIAERVARCS